MVLLFLHIFQRIVSIGSADGAIRSINIAIQNYTKKYKNNYNFKKLLTLKPQLLRVS